MELQKGNQIKVTLDDAYMENCDENVLWLDYKNITKVVEVGSKVYIDDGLISLQVQEIGEHFLSESELEIKWMEREYVGVCTSEDVCNLYLCGYC